MFDSTELKSAARQQIKGSIGILFLCGLLVGLFTGVPTFLVSYLLPGLPGTEPAVEFVAGEIIAREVSLSLQLLNMGYQYAVQMILQALIGAAFSISIVMIYLNLTKGQLPRPGDIFNGFSIFGRALALNILTSLLTLLWTLLFIVPGIVMGIAYSMAPYILAENPAMGPIEAIRASKKLTDGYKLELFLLDLSFLGWILLGIVTLGFGFVYVGPYISATRANAYLKLKALAAPESGEENNPTVEAAFLPPAP